MKWQVGKVTVTKIVELEVTGGSRCEAETKLICCREPASPAYRQASRRSG